MLIIQNPNLILYPLFAMVSLVFIVMGYLGFSRNQAIAKKMISIDFYKVFRTAEKEPEELVALSRNYANLFEAPILFYVVVLFFYVTMSVDVLTLVLAWTYVLCRYFHTVIHIGKNKVLPRFIAFLTSQIVLGSLWVKFFIWAMNK